MRTEYKFICDRFTAIMAATDAVLCRYRPTSSDGGAKRRDSKRRSHGAGSAGQRKCHLLGVVLNAVDSARRITTIDTLHVPGMPTAAILPNRPVQKEASRYSNPRYVV